MPVVTVNGASSQAFPVTYTTNDAFASASALATSINQLVAGGTVATQVYNGTPVTAPGAGQTGELVVTVTGAFTSSGPDNIVVVSAPGPVTVIGAASTATTSVIAGSGGLTFNSNLGSASVVAGDGNNLIGTAITGGGSLNVRTGAGNDTIVAVTGSNIVQAGLGSNSIIGGSASNLVITTGADTISGGASGSDTIVAVGTGSDSVTAFGSNIYFVGLGTTPSTVNGGSGSDTVFASTSGGLYSAGSAGNSTLVGGTAAATLIGGASGDVLFSVGRSVAGGVNAVSQLIAGVGNETIQALYGNLNLDIFAGNNNTSTGAVANTLIGAGNGNDTIFAGTGNATINTGVYGANVAGGTGANADLIAFFKGSAGGVDIINGFRVGTDNLTLQGYAAGEASNDLAKATVAGGNTFLTLSDNTRITIAGVTNLSSSSFI